MPLPVDHLVFLCEICGCQVDAGERATRVAAEAGISDGYGGVLKDETDEEVVFAVFHTDCVVETKRQRCCDSVPYVEEARETVGGEQPRLILYRGGLA